MTFIWYLIGILIGLFGIGSWILETYTDSPIAALWREMGGRNSRETSSSSLASPIISTGLLLLALCALISTTSSQNSTLRMFLLFVVTLGCLLIIIGFICFFPFPVPRWADARYQYMKRHGMLDENGDPLPQFELSEDDEESADNDQGWGTP
ncbi:MAG: hypothetical protein E7C13_06215 [Actinomyces sp.]|nr:hypothetical protein [Actinomyces sp.]